jgi:hypothetical protein
MKVRQITKGDALRGFDSLVDRDPFFDGQAIGEAKVNLVGAASETFARIIVSTIISFLLLSLLFLAGCAAVRSSEESPSKRGFFERPDVESLN